MIFSSEYFLRRPSPNPNPTLLIIFPYRAFGELKSVRIPKKMVQGSEDSHRGFGFVDFQSKPDAKVIFLLDQFIFRAHKLTHISQFQKAFEALGHSTHLYGRRLVLEWAAAEEGVEELRKRTAEHYHETQSAAKRNRKAVFDASTVKTFKSNGDGEDDDDEDE